MDTDFMQKIDVSNSLFTLASDLVHHTSRNIFLTGKAGTGKTTFLRHIRQECPKQMVVVAPTGVAAINAGGVTIHSFFQLPFAPFIPDATGFSSQGDDVVNKHNLLERLRLNSERRRIIQELELLVIDEISMVRCDVLDAIDLVLRHVRHRYHERFGGVQVLFIGDMYQLPPVVKDQEWGLLKNDYASPYFFDSYVIREEAPLYIEFTKIYRQSEEKFISLLNKVRNNEMDDASLVTLHERYQPGFFNQDADGYILLTTHNEKARDINTQRLSALKGKPFEFKAEVEGDFPQTAFPADEVLQLKVGAQVMFMKNDTDKSKRYFNGKIGVVEEVGTDKVKVRCKDEDEAIEVRKEKWDNIRYTLDKSTRNLAEDILGSFNQFPLRLAWAITIHKSQGLTFEKAVIDAGNAFAPGQVYVALSRCTSLEGLVLHSPIRQHALNADDRIVRFTKNALTHDALLQQLATSKKEYQQKVLLSLFQFTKVGTDLKDLHKYLLEHKSSFNTETFEWLASLQLHVSNLHSTAEKFGNQLNRLFLLTGTTEGDGELQNRIAVAADWFTKEIAITIEKLLRSNAITDSATHAKEYNESLKEIFVTLSKQGYLLRGLKNGFSIDEYYKIKKDFVVPSFGVNAYAAASHKKVDLEHPALFYELKKERDLICSRKDLPIYMVASSNTLEEMATYLPQTLDDLMGIKGFGKAKVKSYGAEFLRIINDYCEEHGLNSEMPMTESKKERRQPRQRRADTREETWKLFHQGKPPEEIAKQRSLSIQTVITHLAYFVEQGRLGIELLLDREKIDRIEPVIHELGDAPLTPIKAKLGNEVSYGDIRLVAAHVAFLRSSAHVDH